LRIYPEPNLPRGPIFGENVSGHHIRQLLPQRGWLGDRPPNSRLKLPPGRYNRPAGRAGWAEHYLPVGAADASRSRRC